MVRTVLYNEAAALQPARATLHYVYCTILRYALYCTVGFPRTLHSFFLGATSRKGLLSACLSQLS
jgi:hypothetical protein